MGEESVLLLLLLLPPPPLLLLLLPSLLPLLVLTCAHITAQLIVASSIFVCRIRARREPDWSRISVTARRASSPGGTFCARSTSTAFFAADHQWRCAEATINASRGAELVSSSAETALLLLLLLVGPPLPSYCDVRSVSAASSLPHSSAVDGGCWVDTLMAARSGRQTAAPFASTTQPVFASGAK